LRSARVCCTNSLYCIVSLHVAFTRRVLLQDRPRPSACLLACLLRLAEVTSSKQGCDHTAFQGSVRGDTTQKCCTLWVGVSTGPAIKFDGGVSLLFARKLSRCISIGQPFTGASTLWGTVVWVSGRLSSIPGRAGCGCGFGCLGLCLNHSVLHSSTYVKSHWQLAVF
jgi:hypothetical protein